MQSLLNVKQSKLGMSDKPDFFSTKATVMHIKSKNIAHPACTTQGYNMKVTEINDGWRCEKCDKTHPQPEYQ